MFLLSVEDLLSLLHIQTRTPFIEVIATILLIKLWLLIILSVVVAFNRIKRMISRRDNNLRHLNHLKQIFVFVQSRGLEDLHLKWGDRYFFRRILIQQMELMEPEEQKWLRVLYRQLDFYDEDLKALKSRFWWVRLAAAVRLENMKLEESLPWMVHLVEDSNDFVSMVAIRAISGIESPENVTPVLEALSRRASARRDIFIEILSRMGESHIQELITFLNETYDPHIASICIDVLGLLGAQEAKPSIEKFASSSDDGVAEACARALGELGDSGSIETVRGLVSHDSGGVRSQALRSLARLNDPRLQWAVQQLKDDDDLSVRKAIFSLNMEGTP